MTITAAQLLKIYPHAKDTPLGLEPVAVALNKAIEKMSGRAAAMFIAQTGEESAEYTRFKENLNYSGEALFQLFSKYFKTQAEANLFHRQPERIANHMYCNRMGNGDEASGDGWKYRGRGFIQCTGHDNYRDCGTYLNIDLINHPEHLETLPGAMDSAVWYWNSRNVSKYADLEDVYECTRLINGGRLGLKLRTSNYALAKQLLGVV